LESRDDEPLPLALTQVVERMLAREPANRYAMAADALDALEPWADCPELAIDAWRQAAQGQQVSPVEATIGTDDETLAGLPNAFGDVIRSAIWAREPELDRIERLAQRVEDGHGQVV